MLLRASTWVWPRMQDVWKQAKASPQGQAVAAELQHLQTRLQPVLAGAWDQVPGSLHEHMQQFLASSRHHIDRVLEVLQPYWATSKVSTAPQLWY